jgi:Xaa-Pro dipeptidase
MGVYRLTPKEEVKARIRALQERLSADGVDGAFLVQSADLFYFTGSIQQGVLFVPADGEPVYFVRRVYERALEEAAVLHVARIASPREIPAYFESKKVSFSTIGFEMDVMPVLTFQRFSRLFPDAKAVDVSTAIREIRAVKGASEIEAMRACGRNLAGLLSGARGEIRPGITETWLGGVLQGRAISAGHTTITRMRAWNQEVGLGCVISPVGQGHRPFRENEPILVDLMWAQDGYLVDMARTYVIGEFPEKLQRAYEMAVKVMRHIESATRAGAVAGDLYEIGLEAASRSPFAANFMGAPGYNVRFIGHGVGIEADEFPFIAKGSDTVLASGMTFALEPKFVFPSEGAVGLENTYLVTETGFEKLTLMEEGIIVCQAMAKEGT